MPSAAELEEYLDDATLGIIDREAAEHGWTDDERDRMVKMEACKARGMEDVD